MAKESPSFLRNLFWFVVILGATYLYFKSRGKALPWEGIGKSAPDSAWAVPSVLELERRRESEILRQNAYCDLINRHSERVLDSRARYLSWVDAERGPSGQERHVYGLYSLYELEPTRETYQEAREQAAEMPGLDAAADSFMAALEALHPLVAEAERYYDHSDYLDDGMARGQAMHGPLLAAFARFVRADGALRGQLHALQAQMLAYDLPAAEGRPLDFSQHLSRCALSAYALWEAAAAEGAASFSKDSTARRLQQLEREARALEAKLRSDGASGNAWGEAALRALDEYLKAAKENQRRLNGQIRLDGMDREWVKSRLSASLVRASLPAMTDSYNTWIGTYNVASNHSAPRSVQLIEAELP
jgi:hypothetical protein